MNIPAFVDASVSVQGAIGSKATRKGWSIITQGLNTPG